MLEKNINELMQNFKKVKKFGQVISKIGYSKNKLSKLLQQQLFYFLKILNIPSRQQITLYEKRLAELEHKINSLKERKMVKK